MSKMSKDKPAYRPVYHFVDELLFTAFIERLPRSALTDILRKDELLRKRNFPGFRITETTPNPQQLLAAYRKEILQRSNSSLANNLCEQWIRSSPALATAALQSMGLSAEDVGEVDTWLRKAQDKLQQDEGFDCLRALNSAVTQGFPPHDILIFVSIISYNCDQHAIRGFVEREVLQTHGEVRDPIAERTRLEQRLQSAQSELSRREASREELQRTLAHEASVAQSNLEAAVREHDAAALLFAETQASIQRLGRELAQIKAGLAAQERLQNERNTLKDRSQQAVNHRRAEMVAIAGSHEQKQRHADICILEQSDLVSRMASTLHQLEERILQEARAREEVRIREEAKAQDEARAQEETKAREEARAQEEAKARQQAQLQEEAKTREEARVQEEARAREEARAQEEAKAREQARTQEGGKACEEVENGKLREEARLREEQFGRVPAALLPELPEPTKRTQEGLGNNAVCYQGLQRVFRNTVVGFLRARLTRLFPSDHAQRMKRLFGEQWEKAAQNAALSREIGGTTTTVRDDYDLLGTNHFFELFDKFYDKLFTSEAGQPVGLSKPVKSKFLGNLKAIKDGRDPLSHPVEEEISFEEAHHLLIEAKQILAWLGHETQAAELSALAAQLLGGKADPPSIIRRLPSEDSIYQEFVGRGPILADLATTFASPDKRRFLLAGDGGKGKSAVAYRFAQELSAAPGRFQLIVWLSAKRRRFQEGATVTIELPDFTTAEEAVDRLLTEYGAIASDFSKPMEEKRRLLMVYLDAMPAFIIADDIDTVLDDDDVVSLFTHEIPHTRSAVLLTSRRSIPGIPTFVIREFDGPEVREFVRSRINLYGLDPAPFSQLVIATIAKATDGSPLYMDDLLRLTRILDVKTAVKMWQEKKGDEARKYALQREMEGLSIDARRVLIAAAITDDPISFPELENILNLTEDRLYFTLKELQTLFLFPKPRIVEGEQRFQINLNTKKLVRLVERSSDLYARIERASKALAGKLPDAGQGVISSLVRQAYLRVNGGQHAEAESILLDAIAKYPNATDLRGFLGLAYKRQGRIADARVQFDAASKLKGSKPEMYLQWIKMEVSAREWSKAIGIAERALRVQPNSYEIAECKAYAHRQAGFDLYRGLHHEKAEKMWTEAVEEVKRAIKAPEDLESGARQQSASMLSTIVICLDMLGRFSERDQWLERWEKEHPDDPAVARQKEFLSQKDYQRTLRKGSLYLAAPSGTTRFK